MPTPNPIAAIAAKATAIGPREGPDTPQVPLPADQQNPALALLKMLGLDDPLGVGHGSLSQAVAPPGFGLHLNDELGKVFTPSKGAGLPNRLRLTSHNPDTTTATFHDARTADGPSTPFEASYDELHRLLGDGAIQPEGPAALTVPSLVRKLLKLLPSGE